MPQDTVDLLLNKCEFKKYREFVSFFFYVAKVTFWNCIHYPVCQLTILHNSASLYQIYDDMYHMAIFIYCIVNVVIRNKKRC